MKSLTPAQQVVKIVRDELQETLGGEYRKFVLPSGRIAVVMMAGVQGSGKTTACAKLALRLKKDGRRPFLVAADLERPAAVEQLSTLGDEVGVPVVSEGRDPVKVAKSALKEAERRGSDVVIVDTAGRLHVDVEMMKQAAPHPRRREARSRPHGLRRDDRTGRGDPGSRVPEGSRDDRLRPHEARWRCARRRGPLDHRRHRPPRLLRGRGGEARGSRGLPSRPAWPVASWAWETC